MATAREVGETRRTLTESQDIISKLQEAKLLERALAAFDEARGSMTTAGDREKVKGGDRSDPTANLADPDADDPATAESRRFRRRLTVAYQELRAALATAKEWTTHKPAKPPERPSVPCECFSHERLRRADKASVWAPLYQRRKVDGEMRPLCRWCYYFHYTHGRLPLLPELRRHERGDRVRVAVGGDQVEH